jgi:Sulfotransferase family
MLMLQSFHPMAETVASHASAEGAHAFRERNRRPVFVVGCHRSGTNLLYDTLLSSGGFAVYRGYLPVYETLLPRFGSPSNPRNRQQIANTWMRGKGFARADLDSATLSSRLLAEAHTGGDFIRIVMDEIARAQKARRWAVYDPDNVLFIPQIKLELQEALFVHIVRDGRDIALSLMKMEGFRPFPWSRKSRGLLETALYWQWTVQKGRQFGREIPTDYIEIHYEELVTEPRRALATLGKFLDQDLDYDRIQKTKLGCLSEYNSSFLGDEKETRNPVNRWKEKLLREQIIELESLIGATLAQFDYALTITPEQRRPDLRNRFMASLYPALLSAKHWLKSKTPLGRLADISVLEVLDASSEMR